MSITTVARLPFLVDQKKNSNCKTIYTDNHPIKKIYTDNQGCWLQVKTTVL